MSNVNTPFGAIPGVPAFTTTTTKACDPSYVSLTLKAGEKFVLPSGATIISSTAGAAALESDCADINVEVPECYLFAWGGANNLNDATSMWSSDRTTFRGITLANTFYPHPSPPNILNGDGGILASPVRDWIQNHPVLKNLLSCFGSASSSDGGNKRRGGVGSLCFKTIPSIGNTLFMHVQTGAEASDSGGGGPVNVLIQAQTKGSYPGPRGVCNCSC